MFLRFAFSCALALFFGSCLDSHEEVWLNADASGTARITVQMPADVGNLHGGPAAIENKLIEYFDATPAFTSHSVETSTGDDRLKIEVAFTFADAMKLVDATDPESLKVLPAGIENFIPETAVDFEGLNLVFKRRTELFKVIPGAVFFPKDRLEGHGLTTIVHLPKAARTHNATSTENNGKTLIWKTPLANAFAQPVDNNFTMPLPIPWLTIAVSGSLVILLVLTLGYYFLRPKFTRKKLQPAEAE
jgi:hypothetical protein